MDRVKLAPALFVLALVVFLLPFFTFTVEPTEDASSLLSSASLPTDLQVDRVQIKLSLSGLMMAQLTQSANVDDIEAATKDLEEPVLAFGEALESEPNAKDIEAAFSDFTAEAKKPLLVFARYGLSDPDFLQGLETAADSGGKDGQAVFDQFLAVRQKVKTGAMVVVLSAVLLLGAAVLGFMNGANMSKYSSYVGAGAAAVLAVVAVMGSSSETVAFGGVDLMTASITPGAGLILAIVAGGAGAFLAFRAQPAALPVYSAPVPFATMPAEVSPMEMMPIEPVPAPVTAATVMESTPVAGPAWGATVIEDNATAPGLFASLRVVAGAGMGRGYDVKADGETRLGRDAAMNDIVVSDAKSSGQHAKLRFENGSFTLFDLGSTNGTFVNDVQVLAPVVLKMDDRIKIGDTVMVFQVAQS